MMLEERLQAADTVSTDKQPAVSTDVIPTTESLPALLEQGLQSQDTGILNVKLIY